MMDNTDEAARDPVLSALTDRLGNLIDAELDQHQTAHNTRPQYMLIVVDADAMETVAEISDHEMMFDAMAEIGADWLEDGMVAADADDNGPTSLRIQ